MKTYTIEELKEALDKHTKYLNGSPGGEFLNLYGADLGGANLGGANLGGKTPLGNMLRVIGACMDAVAWVDAQEDHTDLAGLFKQADPEWQSWLKHALGGEPTPERLTFVHDYVTKGVA